VREEKTCRRCNRTLPLAGFRRNRTTRDGLSAYCRECCLAYNNAWKKANPEKVSAYKKRNYYRDRKYVPIPPARRECEQCGTPFETRTNTLYCKDECRKIATRRRGRMHRRKYRFRKEYGLTIAQRDALVRAQCGACAVCGTTAANLVVDHDHDTGAVRGMLCSHCNTGLGFFRDSPAALRAAIDYLTKQESLAVF